LLATVLLSVVVAATAGTLVPRSAIHIPSAIGTFAADVAWENGDAVLIAGEKGVHRYSLRTRAVEQLISTTALPDGLPDPQAVASDGTTVFATSAFSTGGYALRLSDRKRRSAMRAKLLPHDVALHDQRACLLALDVKEENNAAVWCGAVGEAWTKYKPVHRLRSGANIFRQAIARQGGAIAMDTDGSLTVITSAEPGVFHYAPDGKLLETSGQSFDELVLTAMPELRSRFATDVVGRYRLLLNTQPIIEDLVLTPRGPAIVVRIAEKERIRWELWWPRTDDGAVPPTRLGIERIGPYGHLQCDARGRSLACVGSLPDARRAADFRVSELAPYLWIFELPK
jgi:hypothetical protein